MFAAVPIGGGRDHGLTWADRFFDLAFDARPLVEQDRLEDAWNDENTGIPPGAGLRRRAAHKRYLAAARRAGNYAVKGAFTEAEIAGASLEPKS